MAATARPNTTESSAKVRPLRAAFGLTPRNSRKNESAVDGTSAPAISSAASEVRTSQPDAEECASRLWTN